MDEQKRLILAVVLSVLVLVGFQFFFAKPPDPNQQQTPDPAQQEKTVTAEKEVSKPVMPQAPAAPLTAPPVSAAKDARQIEINTPLYHMVITEHGAAVRSMELTGYKETHDPDSPLKQLVSPKLERGTLFFELEGQTIPGLKDAVFKTKEENQVSLAKGETKSVSFVYSPSKDIVIQKVFTFSADSYVIDCDIIFQNGSGMPINDSLVISTPGLYNDEVKKRSRFAFEGPIAYYNNEYTAIKPDDIEDKSTYADIGWSGFTERYFMTVVMPEKAQAEDASDTRLKLTYDGERVQTDFIQRLGRIDPDPGNPVTKSFTIYMGPKSIQILDKFDSSLKESINFGFFHIIAKPLLIVMNMIHGVIPNYGVAIILLTVLIKIVFWPLGTKSYKSMNEMKKVQPLMMEIREKYKDDKQRMNQEIMGLYKTYKVNPVSGCLPMLVQMPIFFALYRMLYQAIELRHAPFVGWITDLSAPDRLFKINFGLDFFGEPGIPMLTLIMGASFFLQQKMAPTGGDPMQARMMMLMPIFMTVLFINFPSGLVLYMLVQNLISMGQQYYTQKKLA